MSMSTVTMLPSGRFRGFARVRQMKDTQVFDREKDAQLWSSKTEERMRKGTWEAPEKVVKVVEAVPGYTVKDAFAHYVESEQWHQLAQSTRTKVDPGFKTKI